MRSTAINLALAMVIGIVIGWLLQSPESISLGDGKPNNSTPNGFVQAADTAASTEGQSADLAALAQQLQQEITARKGLQKQFEVLGQKLAKLERNKPTDTSGDPDTPHTSSTTINEGNTWFNPQALIDAGMEPAAADALKTRFEKQELERLYLRDRAVREGWYGSRRYRNELQKLEAQAGDIKSELDEDSYAAYLYAAGLPNRVTVESVLASSTANNAGILAGDHILRYANKRIYNWQDLREATTQGDINETVPVKIIRNDKVMEVYVQRGPLGIRMSSISADPNRNTTGTP